MQLHTKVIFDDQRQSTFFFQSKWETSEVAFNDASKFEISVTDGNDLWKGIRGKCVVIGGTEA